MWPVVVTYLQVYGKTYRNITISTITEENTDVLKLFCKVITEETLLKNTHLFRNDYKYISNFICTLYITPYESNMQGCFHLVCKTKAYILV